MAYAASFTADASTEDITRALINEGAVVISTLVPPETMDKVYQEIAETVAPEDQQGSSPDYS